jgi:hypothetical protein
MTSLFANPRVAELLGGELTGSLQSIFRAMEIAEEEIVRARGTSEVDREDPVWNAFMLLRTTHPLMQTEFVYRSHCREIVARVRDGKDTRPATDAEIVAGISETSQSFPLNHALVGLQARLFRRAFPVEYKAIAGDLDLDAYERMHGDEMDEWERKLRDKARQDWRTP